MMKKSNKLLSSRRGFSVAEVVVTLAIVMIVTAAMYPLIDSGTRLQAKSFRTFESACIAENAIECFRFAKGNGEKFEEAFNLAEDDLQKVSNNNYEVDKGSYVVKIEIDNNIITVGICNDRDSEAIKEYSYTYLMGGSNG